MFHVYRQRKPEAENVPPPVLKAAQKSRQSLKQKTAELPSDIPPAMDFYTKKGDDFLNKTQYVTRNTSVEPEEQMPNFARTSFLQPTKSCQQFGYFGEQAGTPSGRDIQRKHKRSTLDTHNYEPLERTGKQKVEVMVENEDPTHFEGQRSSRAAITLAHRNNFEIPNGETEKDRTMLDMELESGAGTLTAENLKKFLKGEHIIKIESATDIMTGRQKGKARLRVRAQKSRGS